MSATTQANGHKPFDVIGRSVERRDGRGHVTGSTVYVEDVSYPRMCHVKMVRNPLVHARIKGIDFSAAERVRYRGEPIAAIVGETEEAAIEAAAAVALDLEELPHVLDVEEALQDGAPIVTHWGTNYFVYEGHHCRRVRYGDAPAARARADRVISGRYEPGKEVLRHSHEHTEQVMLILDGEVTMTIEDETRTLVAGDTVVVNRGLEHELHSAGGVTFMEALAPVPLDHVPDRAPDGGSGHVER